MISLSAFNNWRWLGLSLIVIVLDQLTKLYADSALQLYTPVAVLPGINFTLMYNSGAAFSFLSDAGGWQRWFFTAAAIIISAVILVWMQRLARDDKWTLLALALILGGAIGNVIDRILYGHVIDYLDVYYRGIDCLPGFAGYLGECHWPAFNIADAAISLSVVLLIIDGLFAHRRHAARQDS